MVLFNHSTRELTAKIVYYGPGLCGKTTNLRVLHERLEKGNVGRLLSLSTAQDRTIYFDLLPVELGNIKGYTVRFQLCTVPGQVFYNETRKLVLRGVDGIVFVVDSQWSMLSHNLESFQNLRENMREADMDLDAVPVVIQYNKRDLPGVLSVGGLQESLNFQNFPYVEAVANEGKGVVETFKLVSRLTFVELLRRLQKSGGLEGESLAVAEGGHDESLARALSRADRRPPEPDATPFTDSPFETTGSWPAPATGEVFGDMTGVKRRTVFPQAPPPSATTIAMTLPPAAAAPAPSPVAPAIPPAASASSAASPEADHGPFSVAIRLPIPPPPSTESFLAFDAPPAPALEPAALAAPPPEPTAIAAVAPLAMALEPPPPPPPPVVEMPPPPPPPEPRASLADVEALRSALDGLVGTTAPLAEAMASLRRDLDDLRSRVESVAAETDGSTVVTGSLRKELSDVKSQLLEALAREPGAAAAVTALQESVATLGSRADADRAALQESIAVHGSRVDAERAAREEALAAFGTRAESDRARLDALADDDDDVKAGIRELAGRIELVTGTVESARSATNELGARVTALAASEPVHREEAAAALRRLESQLAEGRTADAAAVAELRARVDGAMAAVAALASQGREDVSGLEARVQGALDELRAHRDAQESRSRELEETVQNLRASLSDSEKRRDEGLVPLLSALETVGADRAGREAEAAELARRLAGFEEELARQRDESTQARKRAEDRASAAEERVSAAEGRVRKLAESLRQALSALGE